MKYISELFLNLATCRLNRLLIEMYTEPVLLTNLNYFKGIILHKT